MGSIGQTKIICGKAGVGRKECNDFDAKARLRAAGNAMTVKRIVQPSPHQLLKAMSTQMEKDRGFDITQNRQKNPTFMTTTRTAFMDRDDALKDLKLAVALKKFPTDNKFTNGFNGHTYHKGTLGFETKKHNCLDSTHGPQAWYSSN
jgi:hypothetical protein